MIDINELRRLAQAVSGWSNCNQAWLDQSEDVQAAVVGHIDEDGNTYPVATIDCDQYYAAHQSLPLAKFYAAANPAVISELLDRLEAAEKERDNANAAAAGVALHAGAMQDRLEAAEKSDAESLAMYRKARDERDALRAAVRHEADCVEACKSEIERLRAENAGLVDDMNLLRDNNTALRARIEEMDKQESVATVIKEGDSRYWMSERLWMFPDGKYPLYALPGAQTQGEEK